MRRVIRWLLPAVLVLVWLAVSGLGGPFFGQLSDVQSQSQAAFLPENAESTQVRQIQQQSDDNDAAPPAIIVATADGGLTPDMLEELDSLLDEAAGIDGIGDLSPPIPAETADGADAGADSDGPADGAAVAGIQAFASITGSPDEVVGQIRETFDGASEAITIQVTGPAGFSADLSDAFGGIDSLLLLVAVAAVFLILLLVYRSPILPLLVLVSAIGALAVSVVAVYLMADRGWIDLNGQAQGILFILVIGAATDYALLLIARYRDALRDEADHQRALRRALRGVIEPILASASTVIAGLLCLLLSDLSSNQALGPVASIGVVCAVLATTTFLPALLALLGRVAFYPFVPAPPDGATQTGRDRSGWRKIWRRLEPSSTSGMWEQLAAATGKYPRRIWVSTTLALAVTAAFAITFQGSGVAESELLLGEPESVAGQETVAELFAAGTGSPAIVIGDVEQADALLTALEADEGVAEAAPGGADDGGPPDDVEANGGPPDEVEADNGGPPDEVDADNGGQPEDDDDLTTYTVDGREVVELQGTLADSADSDAAIETVERLRDDLRDIDEGVLIGGESATALDTRQTATDDLTSIIPLVLLVITLILMLLLRAVVAPLLLIVATTVSFLSALGISALVFNHLLGFPGADPVVPLFAFVFLVALGIDYSIFLSTRAREEAVKQGTRPGVLEALRATGGVITSAGVVLAATFAALAVIPLLFLVQLAFIVAVGVLIDTLIVRSLVIPGLFYDIGAKIWWPSRLSKRLSKPSAQPAVDRTGQSDGDR